MALLIPTTVDINIVKKHSLAEAKIINEVLKLDPVKTKDWVIYYSYYFKGRTNRRSKQYTMIKNHNEVDFLILAPNVGIFVFEIKGGIISYSPYTGFTTLNRYLNKHFKIDPYNQAKENYYGINDILGKLIYSNKYNKNIYFDSFIGGTLVGFPDISTLPNVGLQSDMDDTYVEGMDLYDFIMRNSHNHIIRHDNKILPTKGDIDLIISKLKGNYFSYSLSEVDYIESINLRINELTEEQTTIFRGLFNNKRCLIKGGPGTGKTVLCEFLYKHLTIDENKKVLYLTKNKLVAEKIKFDLGLSKVSKCMAIKEFLKDFYKTNINSKDIKFDKDVNKMSFYLKEINNFIKVNEIDKYDSLIIDEAQDIEENEDILNLFNNLIIGGLKDGMCYIFFDDNQRIIKRRQDKICNSELFKDNGYRYTNFELIKNCRNGKGVREVIDNLTSLDSDIVNEDVKYYEDSNYKNIVNNIITLIHELESKGILKLNITILFNINPKNDKNLIYEELKNYYNDDLIPYDFKTMDNVLTFSTVSKFKGLENDVIIYVNDKIDLEIEDHYVAISRAKVYAYIFKLK